MQPEDLVKYVKDSVDRICSEYDEQIEAIKINLRKRDALIAELKKQLADKKCYGNCGWDSCPRDRFEHD